MKRAASLLMLFVVASNAYGEWFNQQQNAMGTQISVSVWHGDSNVANKTIAEIMAEMNRIDETYSPYIETSELSRLNQLAALSPQVITEEMTLLLATAYKYSELTQGAFDITYASVGHLYDYREKKQPTELQRKQKLNAIDYRKVQVEDGKVVFLHPDVVIDLGGIAKGYAADQAIAIMQKNGITHGSFSAGGDSRLLGDRLGRPWLVGIENPRQPDAIAITLPLDNTAVSTSGDYERFFIDQQSGQRIHHIINPKSGTSVKGVSSVTILGSRGLDTDPLSTSVFVLGVEKGLALVNRLNGVDAIIIDAKGKVFYSEGLSLPSN